MYTTNSHSFVICAYKESEFLEECITSLLAQTEASTILMATSTPNKHITQLAERYNIPLHINTGEAGIAGDWNFALSCATTELVTIAHQDDIYEPHYTHDMLRLVNQAQDPVVYFTNYGELRQGMRVDDNKLLNTKRMLLKPLCKSQNWSKKSAKRRALAFGNAICCPSVTLITSRYTDNPLFYANFGSNLDWETWARMLDIPGSFVYNTRISMYHRIHEESETSHLIANNKRAQEDYAMLCQFWPKPLAWLLNQQYKKGQASNEE